MLLKFKNGEQKEVNIFTDSKTIVKVKKAERDYNFRLNYNVQKAFVKYMKKNGLSQKEINKIVALNSKQDEGEKISEKDQKLVMQHNLEMSEISEELFEKNFDNFFILDKDVVNEVINAILQTTDIDYFEEIGYNQIKAVVKAFLLSLVNA